MGLKNECFENHMAQLEKLLLFLLGSPAELCIFKVSHKIQMHIAVCSGLKMKKVGSNDPTEEILEINNAGIIHLETLAVKKE